MIGSRVFGGVIVALGSLAAPQALYALPARSVPALDEAKKAPSGDLLIGKIQIEGADALDIKFGFDSKVGIDAYVFPTEDRPGVASVIGIRGVVPGLKGKSGLSLLAFIHFYSDGAHFLEGQILNDSMTEPPGKVNATWHLEFRGEVVADGHGPILDECAIAFASGPPRFAPRADLWSAFTAGLPDPKKVSGVPRKDAEPVADPDPKPSTHAAGSPRSRYVAVAAAKYYFTQDDRYLARLMDYVIAQARRPYHLSEADGSPFLFSRHPEAWFVEGRPELKPYRDTFGRIALSKVELEAPPQNGWDHEHMNVEELYASYVLFGSRIARRELLLIAEQLLSTGYVREEGHTQHSARAFGWVARLLVRAHQVSGEERYLDGVRRMMDSVRKHAIMTGPYPAFIPQEPKADHMASEKFDTPFMIAVATSAIALYLKEAPKDDKARELLKFCGDLLVDQGYSREKGGFFYDFSCESKNKHGEGDSIDGVVIWIPSALVEVAAEMPEAERAKYLEPAKQVFQRQAANDWGKPSSTKYDEYYKWMLRAAREFQ